MFLKHVLKSSRKFSWEKDSNFQLIHFSSKTGLKLFLKLCTSARQSTYGHIPKQYLLHMKLNLERPKTCGGEFQQYCFIAVFAKKPWEAIYLMYFQQIIKTIFNHDGTLGSLKNWQITRSFYRIQPVTFSAQLQSSYLYPCDCESMWRFKLLTSKFCLTQRNSH